MRRVVTRCDARGRDGIVRHPAEEHPTSRTAATPAGVELRPAQPTDAPHVAELLGELGYPSPVDETRRRLVRLLESADDRIVVASRDGEPIGVGSVHRLNGLHDTNAIAFITALVVTERERGSGVGRALLAALEDAARGWGCERILVTSANRRADAHAFYERGGYEGTGRRFARALVP